MQNASAEGELRTTAVGPITKINIWKSPRQSGRGDETEQPVLFNSSINLSFYIFFTKNPDVSNVPGMHSIASANLF